MNNLECFIEKSKDNKNVVGIIKDEKKIFMGSTYSVERDVQKLIDSLEGIGEYDIILIFGLGAGEHILSILPQIGEFNKIVVFEPSSEIINTFKALDYSAKIIDDKRIHIFHFQKDKNEEVENELLTIIRDYEVANIKLTWFANYDRVFDKEYVKFIETIKYFITRHTTNRNTLLYHSRIWFNSFFKNIKVMAKSTPVDRFKDKFKDKPVIIVSAGPSLKKNVHLLKDAQDKFIILTGGRNLKSLLDIGVIPDFVCVIDADEKTFKLMEPVLDSSVPLVFYEGANVDLIQNYKGNKAFFAGFDFTNDFFHEDFSILNLGGSVAHTCFGLSVILGCSTVIFIGQDFAFTGDKIHAEMATIDEEENSLKDSKDYFLVDDINGGKVYTDLAFDLFRKRMEKLITQYPNRTYINATEGGANIKGTEIMTLQSAIEKYGDNNLNKEINDSFSYIDEERYMEVNRKLNNAYKKLYDLKEECIKAANLSEKLYDFFDGKTQNNIEDINKKLNKLDKKINKGFKDIGYVNFILYPMIQTVLSAREFRASKNDNESERGKKIALKNKMLYKETSVIIDEAIKIMKESID